MDSEELKQPFLSHRDDTDYKDTNVEEFAFVNTGNECPHSDIRNHPKYRRIGRFGLILLVLSLLGNVFLLYENGELKHAPDLGRSRFSGLGYDYPVEYKVHTDYGGSNSTLADQLWEAIDSSPIIVALTDEYATAHNLKTSARFPWDDAKGIYHVKAFHHLHCLKSLRKAYTDMRLGNPQIVPTDHFYHCLDTLRQDMMCLADDTPMPTVNAIHHIGNGQVRQCRNWDKLVAWTQEPERHGCYRMLDDYRKVPHTLEEFGFCDKDSQYYPVAKEYFEQNGHKNPYAD